MAILGLYFQIRDDYANLNLKEVNYIMNTNRFKVYQVMSFGSQYAENKSFCEDLTEGKFSFPVIHAIRSRPDDHQIINILRQRTKDMDVKRYCVSLLDKFGSFEYTRQTLIQLDLDARQEIEKLGGNPILERVLDELKNWWIQPLLASYSDDTTLHNYFKYIYISAALKIHLVVLLLS